MEIRSRYRHIARGATPISPGRDRIELSVRLRSGAVVSGFRFVAQPPDPAHPPGGGPPGEAGHV